MYKTWHFSVFCLIHITSVTTLYFVGFIIKATINLYHLESILMKIENLMTKKLITLNLDDDLNKAREIFNRYKIHHVLILNDEGELAGVITDRDIFKHLSPTIGTRNESPKDITLSQKRIHQIMSRNLVCGQTELSVSAAVLLFHDNHVSCLPIIDKNNKPIGILTWRDILKVVAYQYRKKLSE